MGERVETVYNTELPPVRQCGVHIHAPRSYKNKWLEYVVLAAVYQDGVAMLQQLGSMLYEGKKHLNYRY
jgi:hypothetical protein